MCFGLLGPGNNAHCPNENMSLDFCQMLIRFLAQIIAQGFTLTQILYSIKQHKFKNKIKLKLQNRNYSVNNHK